MIMTRRKVLGISFEERAATVAEARGTGGAARIERCARFDFPADVSWEDPARLGKAFALFLRQQRFAARQAVAGLPARWLTAREVTVPPADADTTAAMVRMHAERELSGDLAELALDYTDAGDAAQARSVLLVAALRPRLDRLSAMAQAARVDLLAVTSDALLLAGSAPAEAPCAITLLLRSGGADIVTRLAGHFCSLRDVPWRAGADAASGAALLNEVRRAVAGVSARHKTTVEPTLALWDGAGLPAAALADLAAQLGAGVRVGSAREHGVVGPNDADGLAPAVALAAAGVEGRALPFDLLHSRLQPPARRLPRRQVLAAAAAALILLIGALALVFHWRSQRAVCDELEQRLTAMKKETDAARALVDRVALARGWYEERPKMLDCLRELSAAFPTEGRIWVTNLTVKPAAAPSKSLRGVLSGKSRDERSVRETLDRMKKAKGFSDLKLIYVREAGRTVREVSFAASFTYAATE